VPACNASMGHQENARDVCLGFVTELIALVGLGVKKSKAGQKKVLYYSRGVVSSSVNTNFNLVTHSRTQAPVTSQSIRRRSSQTCKQIMRTQTKFGRDSIDIKLLGEMFPIILTQSFLK
jgi:hypothetical protein